MLGFYPCLSSKFAHTPGYFVVGVLSVVQNVHVAVRVFMQILCVCVKCASSNHKTCAVNSVEYKRESAMEMGIACGRTRFEGIHSIIAHASRLEYEVE